jgi:hypothetical protein
VPTIISKKIGRFNKNHWWWKYLHYFNITFGIIEYKYNVSESQDQTSQQILSFYASSETETFFMVLTHIYGAITII